MLALAVALVVGGTVARTQEPPSVPPAVNTPYVDARPILAALRQELLPAELRGRTPAQLESAWPGWLSRRDAEIRADKGSRRIEFDFDLFNVMNSVAPFAVTFVEGPTYGFVTDATPPRIARVGLRYSF